MSQNDLCACGAAGHCPPLTRVPPLPPSRCVRCCIKERKLYPHMASVPHHLCRGLQEMVQKYHGQKAGGAGGFGGAGYPGPGRGHMVGTGSLPPSVSQSLGGPLCSSAGPVVSSYLTKNRGGGGGGGGGGGAHGYMPSHAMGGGGGLPSPVSSGVKARQQGGMQQQRQQQQQQQLSRQGSGEFV